MKKRLTIPDKNDKRYIQYKYGGDYLGILGSPSYFTGSALGNCVAYAFCRRQEIEKELTGNQKTMVGVASSLYKPTRAYLWYGLNDGYERSKTTPKIGSVVCWKHNGENVGHVAIIEDMASNGKDWIQISESGYGNNGYVFRTCKIYPTYCNITAYNVKTGKYSTSTHWNYKFKNGVIIKNNCTFQGYIYPPLTTTITQEFNVGDKVKVKGLTRYVLAITKLEDGFLYKVGLPKTALIKERVTGWYGASDLTKL